MTRRHLQPLSCGNREGRAMRARAMAAAVLLTAAWTSGARAGPADTTARALVADWKDGGPRNGRGRRSHRERLRQRNVLGRDDRRTPALLPAAERSVHWQPGDEHPRELHRRSFRDGRQDLWPRA